MAESGSTLERRQADLGGHGRRIGRRLSGMAANW